jgi:hypothetical protein
MIEPRDIEFHPVPQDQAELWTETNYFPFAIPEAGLSGCVYNVFRPGLGVCMSDVTIFDRCATHAEGLAYADNQQHIPCPASLANYSLRNGVQVTTFDAPSGYRVSYTGIDDTELHFEYRGLMRPQDFNDPEQDPLVRRQQTAGGAWGGAFNGHFDMTGRAIGELKLRGKRHRIDCISTMDHSWGPRKERDNGNAAIVQAHFGEDFAIHALTGLDPRRPDAIGPIYHGYVLADGKVRGLVAGRGKVVRFGMFPASIDVSLEDEHGQTYELTGSFLTWAPWAPYPSILYYQGLARWNLQGRIGQGPYQEIISRAFVTRHRLSD